MLSHPESNLVSAGAHLDGVLGNVLAAFAPADHQASLSIHKPACTCIHHSKFTRIAAMP